jgi:L-seryl-tRNA(Ser) seleniumtransferase
MPKIRPERQLPAVHELVKKAAAGRERPYPAGLLTATVRQVLAAWRQAILEQGAIPPDLAGLTREVRQLVEARLRPHLRPVINATGVVLHTNLGRAPLSSEACAAIERVARGYCNLELNLEDGKRGSRYDHVERLLTSLTGAEAALVVNNNAAAVLLVLDSLAHGREVVVSRGELVEIGGSFRIPEVLSRSGAIMKEVGTTNKTHLQDYERAIGPETAMLLKVHPSNYRIMGFTCQVTDEELVDLAARRQVIVVEDLGSGALVDLSRYGVGPEPTVQASLTAGVDIVTFSGDKLLGGPQAGLILGSAELLRTLKENQLLRALRVDKFTLAALEATLQAYVQEEAEQTLPVLQMLTVTPASLQQQAVDIQKLLAGRLGTECAIAVRKGSSMVGGGALPLEELPTTLLELRPRPGTPHSSSSASGLRPASRMRSTGASGLTPGLKECGVQGQAEGLDAKESARLSAAGLAERLRRGDPPVLAHIQDDCVLLDPRTLQVGEAELLVEAVVAALSDGGEG